MKFGIYYNWRIYLKKIAEDSCRKQTFSHSVNGYKKIDSL